MIEIIPAILEQTWSEVAKRLNEAEAFANSPNGSGWVQIDIADGIFTPTMSWHTPAELAEHLGVQHPSGKMPNIEIDMMVAEPEEKVESWIRAGAKRVIIHIESTTTEKLQEIITRLSNSQVEVGLALNIDTPNEALEPWIGKIDFAQFMGIAKIGYQGQAFDPRVLPKIKDLRKKYPNAIIQVDGGVNAANAPLLKEAGANRLVVGSAIQEFIN